MKVNVPPLARFPSYLKDIESRWKVKLARRFDRERYVGSKEEQAAKGLPRYVLSMFPYPSGRLHLGHVRIYTSGDILARYSRLLMKNEKCPVNYTHVINPMGFDSFGLPAENAARERGLQPASWTNSNIRTMKQQLDDLALQLDWREATSNPSYYKWTQEIFLKLFDAGLVYKSYSKVNWDPVDKTVLADEQVDEHGRSWRSGAVVQRRNFRQWFIKVNAFTNEIYKASEVDPDSWRDILAVQRNWIGKPSGWMFYVPFKCRSTRVVDIIPVFTRRPELFLKSSTRLIISKDHWLEEVHRISNTGYITNPITGANMQVVITGRVELLPSNCQATLAESERSLSDQEEVEPDVIGNSDRDQVILQAQQSNLGGYYTSNKYRDWLVSRQRYWGTPIPIVDCESCGHAGVGRESLPVKLPLFNSSNMTQKNEGDEIVSSLRTLAPDEWLSTTCPDCGSTSQRECDTFDTLFDSSWYFLRYASSPSQEEPYDKHRVQPVWCYIGGKEHACMHLFYARFMTHFLHSCGLLSFKEPFAKLLVQGVVKSRTFKLNGKYLSQDEVASIENTESLVVEYEKMSKSKGNGVDPQELLDEYGVDATRFCLMSYANPRSERLWRSNQEEFRDVLIFMRRISLTVQDYLDVGLALNPNKNEKVAKPTIKELSQDDLRKTIESLIATRNKCSLDAMFNIQESNQFRQYISSMHVLTNAIRTNIKNSSVYSKEFAECLAALIVMLNPIAPHFTEELWAQFSQCIINPLRNEETSNYKTALQASDQPWPVPDDPNSLATKIANLKAEQTTSK